MSKDYGGRAFPAHGSMGEVISEGMFLRDYFAAKSMQAMIATPTRKYASTDQCLSDLAKASYMIADAMLAERAK